MVKKVEATSIGDKLEVGDLVLTLSQNPAYARVVKIVRRYAQENDWDVKSKYSNVKAGDELTPHIHVEKVLHIDLTKPGRRAVSSLRFNEYKKIDREFIKQIFRKVNDELACSVMLKEYKET